MVRGLRSFLLLKLLAPIVFVLLPCWLTTTFVFAVLVKLLVFPFDKIDGGMIEFDFLFISLNMLAFE